MGSQGSQLLTHFCQCHSVCTRRSLLVLVTLLLSYKGHEAVAVQDRWVSAIISIMTALETGWLFACIDGAVQSTSQAAYACRLCMEISSDISSSIAETAAQHAQSDAMSLQQPLSAESLLETGS